MPPSAMPDPSAPSGGWNRVWPILLFPFFAFSVYLIHGHQPPIGPDHIAYINLANDIIAMQPTGNYQASWTSSTGLSVVMAYLLPYTGSHVSSLKVILAANTIFFLWFFYGFVGIFCRSDPIRALICCVSAMSVSFGVTSWGLTDSAALLARSLALPWIIACLWLYFGRYHSWQRYLAMPLLVVVSTLHLGSFHVLGAIGTLEILDWLFIRRRKFSYRVPMFIGSVICSFAVLGLLERTGKSLPLISAVVLWQIHPPGATGSEQKTDNTDLPAPTSGGKLNPLLSRDTIPTDTAVKSTEATKKIAPLPYTPTTAWQLELTMRSWRNMPLPLINLVNIVSSSVLIISLSVYGYINVRRRRALNELDHAFSLFAVAVVIFAFLPQTAMWILRNLRPVFPLNFEEIRTLSWLMLPCIYFSYRLFAEGSLIWPRFQSTTRNRMLVALAFLALPLTLKSFTYGVREQLFKASTFLNVVDSTDQKKIENARQALGISHKHVYYHDIQPLRIWAETHLPPNSIFLTNRDDLFDSKLHLVGTRQQAVLANPQDDPAALMANFEFTRQAMESRDLPALLTIARKLGATHVLVLWTQEDFVYQDDRFSIVAVPRI